MLTRRPHSHPASIDRTPCSRMFSSVIAGPVWREGMRMYQQEPPLSASANGKTKLKIVPPPGLGSAHNFP
jgi:hypothetical protein